MVNIRLSKQDLLARKLTISYFSKKTYVVLLIRSLDETLLMSTDKKCVSRNLDTAITLSYYMKSLSQDK